MKESNTYHNTTNQSKEFVKVATKKFKNQENEVMYIMKEFKRMTASEVWNLTAKTSPITSIRRAMSNLKRDSLLFKKKKTKIGLYGDPEHYYELFDLDKLF